MVGTIPENFSPKKNIVYFIAGEPSGDYLGGKVINALKKSIKNDPYFRETEVMYWGIGGPLMEAEGLKSLYPLSDFGIMGFFDDWRKYIKIYKALNHILKKIKEDSPAFVFTVDFPGFNFLLAKKLKKLNQSRPNPIPLIHYVAPTVWAWRPRRAKKVSKFLTHLLTLFSFEPPYFKREGLKTTFVGHPLMEDYEIENLQNPIQIKHEFCTLHHLEENLPILCILPGSRESEIRRHLPIFQETMKKVKENRGRFHIIMPTLESLIPLINELWTLDDKPILIMDPNQKKQAYGASDFALAASGTVSLELALAGLPMLITYKTSKLSAWIAKRLLKIKYVCLVNILLKKSIVPEYLQDKCDPNILSEALIEGLKDQNIRKTQQNEFQYLKTLLWDGFIKPSEHAAEILKEYLRKHCENK